MTQHRSFVPSDFSLRDVPLLLLSYLTLSAGAVVLGLALDGLPEFWSGVLVGLGGGLSLAWMAHASLIAPQPVQLDALPEVSGDVARICDDPARSPAEATKAYCDQHGVGLREGKAAIDAYLARKQT